MDLKLILGWILLGLVTVQGSSLWSIDEVYTPKQDIEPGRNPLVSIFQAMAKAVPPFKFDDYYEAIDDETPKNVPATKTANNNPHDIHNNNEQRDVISSNSNQEQSQDNTHDTKKSPEQFYTVGIKMEDLPPRGGSNDVKDNNNNNEKLKPVLWLPAEPFEMDAVITKDIVEKTPLQRLVEQITKMFTKVSQRDQDDENSQTKDVENTDEKHAHTETVFNIKTVNINNDNAQMKSVASSIMDAANMLTGKTSMPVTFNIDTLNLVTQNEKADVKTPSKEPCGEIQIADLIANGAEEQNNQQTPGPEDTADDPLVQLKRILETGGVAPNSGRNGKDPDEFTIVLNKEGRYLTLIPKNTGESGDE